MSIRDKFVQQGVRFLQHPKVQHTSLSQRLAFLEKKGLTPEEVSESLSIFESNKKNTITLKSKEQDDVPAYTKRDASETSWKAGERLKGRVVLVVGGNHDLGRSITLCCANEGALTVVFDCEQATEKTEKSISKFITGDCCSPDDIDRAINACVEEYGRIDALVNYIDIPGEDKNLMETDVGEWQSLFGMNAKSVFLWCKQGIQQMLTQEMKNNVKGKIINISSKKGMLACPNSFVYGVSKSIIVQLTRKIAREYGKLGIVCNSVAPGKIMDTNSVTNNSLEINDKFIYPRCGFESDIAKAVVFLASDEAGFIQGTNLLIDGGMLPT